MDHPLMILPLSENFSAQYTQLAHFTRTSAQTRHRNQSLSTFSIQTPLTEYNYNFEVSVNADERTKWCKQRYYTKPFAVQAICLSIARPCQVSEEKLLDLKVVLIKVLPCHQI